VTIPDDIHPLVLHDFLNKLFKSSWILWIPETIYKELNSLNYFFDRVVKDKIMALKVIYKIDYFWEHFHVFEKVCVVFNDREAFFNQVQKLMIEEIYFANYVANKLRPNMEYSPEVIEFIKVNFKEEGQIYSPKELDVFGNYKIIEPVVKRIKQDGFPENPTSVEIQAITLIRLEKYKELKDNKGREQMKLLEIENV